MTPSQAGIALSHMSNALAHMIVMAQTILSKSPPLFGSWNVSSMFSLIPVVLYYSNTRTQTSTTHSAASW